MKEYNEQVVETLDDAGCIIANKNIIIDNLQARIAELEEELLKTRLELLTSHGESEELLGRIAELEAEVERTNDAFEQEHKACHDLIEKVIPNINKQLLSAQAENARLKAECDDIKQVQFPRKLEAVAAGWKTQLAASQAYAEQLREALSSVEWEDFHFDHHGNGQQHCPGCGNQKSVGRHTIQCPIGKALAIPRDTSALDAYVAEKVKEYGDEARRQMQHATKAVWQRDLAVEALKWLKLIFTDSEMSQERNPELWMPTVEEAIKESEGE